MNAARRVVYCFVGAIALLLPGLAVTFCLGFVQALTQTVDAAGGDEARILHEAAPLVAELVAHDDWLPATLAQPLAGSYGQYLLYRDPSARFTAVAFVWDVGASTPIHDHMVWGIVGVLRGSGTPACNARQCGEETFVEHGIGPVGLTTERGTIGARSGQYDAVRSPHHRGGERAAIAGRDDDHGRLRFAK